MSDPDASVVIGYKDWGLDRLSRCVKSIKTAFGELQPEIIVSDYGSADGNSVAEVAAYSNARYLRTDTDGTWSRARALNAGFSVAKAQQFFSTDADMIFRPGTLAAISRRLDAFPDEAIILQCRDLPAAFSGDAEETRDWDRYLRAATLRPRWGMGGLVATHRDVFGRLRGYDERMHTYGGEDMDYAKRLRRSGVPINWLDQPGVKMYHVWHPSSRLAASLDEASAAAVAANRRIHDEDVTAARNRTASEWLQGAFPPLVTVVAQADRRPQQLIPELNAILGQSVSDIEVLLVDTSSHASAVAELLGDTRVRVVPCPEAGWWHAVHEAAGTYILLHSSGSWYPSDRLQRLLEISGTRGVMPGDLSQDALLDDSAQLRSVPSAVGSPQRRPWASVLLPTDTVRNVLGLLSSPTTDLNDMLYALLRNGLSVKLVEGAPRVDVIRGGDDQEVHNDLEARHALGLWRRLDAAHLDCEWLTKSPTIEAATSAVRAVHHMIFNQVSVVMWCTDDELLDRAQRLTQNEDETASRFRVTDGSGHPLFGVLHLGGVTSNTERRLHQLARATGGIEVNLSGDAPSSQAPALAAIHQASQPHGAETADVRWVVVRTNEESLAVTATTFMEKAAGLSLVKHHLVSSDGSTSHLVLARADDTRPVLSSLTGVRETIGGHGDVDLWLLDAPSDMTLSTLAAELT